MWRQAWEHVIPFFAFPPEVRRVIYTTNALESVHARVRKIIKTRGHFPDRRSRDQADLAGAAQHHRRLGPARDALESGAEPIRDPATKTAS